MRPAMGMIKKGQYELKFNYIPVKATKEQIKLCREFAPAYYEARKEIYEKRGQANAKNIINQAYTSKVFEFMVYNYIKGMVDPEKFDVTPPSVEIYTGKKRPKYDDDLVIINKETKSKTNIHVKSQDYRRISGKFPASWGFQKVDPIWSKKKNDILILGFYKNETQGQIVCKDKVASFIPYLADPKSEKLRAVEERRKKVFLYFDPTKEVFDLIKHS